MRSLSTLGFLSVVAAVAALYERHALFAHGWAGLAVQAAGIALIVWARLTFGARSFHFSAPPTRGGLVTSGPYGLVRNPIYAGGLLVIGAGVAAHLSTASVALATLALVGTMLRILCEERMLATEYPDYAAYRRTTPRLVPSLGRLGSVFRNSG